MKNLSRFTFHFSRFKPKKIYSPFKLKKSTLSGKNARPTAHSASPFTFHFSHVAPAFTLAEVLITLAIIGVVAAMTIPTLMGVVQEQVLKNRWKKAYSDLNNALELVKADEGIGTVNSYFSCTELHCSDPLVVKILAKYKFANKNKNMTGWSQIYNIIQYKTITGVQWPSSPILHAGYDMNDITIYYWSYWAGGCTIWVDVNGYRNKPNTLGKDLFAVELRGGKMVPMGAKIVIINTAGKNGQSYFATGDWCSGQGTTLNADIQGIGWKYYAGIGCSAEYIYGDKK